MLKPVGVGYEAGNVHETVRYTGAFETRPLPVVVTLAPEVAPVVGLVPLWVIVTTGGAGYAVPPGTYVYTAQALKSCGADLELLND